MRIMGPLYASLVVDAIGGFSPQYVADACCLLSFVLVAAALINAAKGAR